MINRRNIYFVSLFSLILILGVYYITLPSEIFENKTNNVSKEIDIKIEESDILMSLRAERNEEIESTMKTLQETITNEESTTDMKNEAFNELQLLNLAKGKETYLEDKILNEFNIKSFVEINNDIIKVTISSKEHNTTIANNIMRSIQDEFKEKKSITIKFDS